MTYPYLGIENHWVLCTGFGPSILLRVTVVGITTCTIEVTIDMMGVLSGTFFPRSMLSPIDVHSKFENGRILLKEGFHDLIVMFTLWFYVQVPKDGILQDDIPLY